MWRRIPLLPMLFGVFAAWALFGMLMAGDPVRLTDLRAFLAAGALGALFALVVRPMLRAIGSPSSFGRFGFGCMYACLGVGFVAAIAVIPALMLHTSVAFSDLPGLLAVASFGGLGILGGLMMSQFRRGEGDRQQLALARDLQQRLLPPPVFESEAFRITARIVPASYVAGDFYDFIPLAGGGLLIVIADVAGKGVAAGLMMATVKAVLPLLASEDPASVLQRVNERLALRASRRDFVAIIAAVYEPASGALSIANAGLPDPLVIGEGAPRAVVVSGPRYPAGIRSPLAYRATTMTLAAGERVLFFTDGLPEASVAGDQLGYERLAGEVQHSRGDLASLFDQLERAKASHDDDWTAVVLERLA